MRYKVNSVGHPTKSVSPPPARSENVLETPGVPAVPSSLGTMGIEVWESLWSIGTEAYNPLTDRFIIERYCSLQDRRLSLQETVDKDGMITVGSQGQDVLHPAMRALDSVEKELRALEDRLGLNPEARARLNIASIQHKSALEAFEDEEGL